MTNPKDTKIIESQENREEQVCEAVHCYSGPCYNCRYHRNAWQGDYCDDQQTYIKDPGSEKECFRP